MDEEDLTGLLEGWCNPRFTLSCGFCWEEVEHLTLPCKEAFEELRMHVEEEHGVETGYAIPVPVIVDRSPDGRIDLGFDYRTCLGRTWAKLYPEKRG